MIRSNIIILISIIGMLSCSGNRPDPVQVVNLEGEEFICHVSEKVRMDTTDLIEVVFSTVNGNYCENATITGSSSETQGMITFNLHHINQKQSCDLPQYNPSRNLVAGNLKAGEYPVQLFISQSISYDGILTVRTDIMKLEFFDAPTIMIQPEVTKRVRDRTFWFRIYYLQRDAHKARECIEEVEEYSGNYSFSNGFYSYFQVKDGDFTIFEKDKYPDLEHQDHVIIMHSTENVALDSLFSIFRDYAKQTTHHFSVDLKTWQGKEYTIE